METDVSANELCRAVMYVDVERVVGGRAVDEAGVVGDVYLVAAWADRTADTAFGSEWC